MITKTIQALLLTVFAFAAPSLASDVHVVDVAGSGDFTSLAAAIAAAADGDVLLVRNSNPGGITLGGKGLTIINEGSPLPTLPLIRCTSLPGSSEIHIVGFDFLQLQLVACQGRILIEDCGDLNANWGEAIASVSSCSSVTMINTGFKGFDGSSITNGQDNWGADGGHALTVSNSNVNLYNCRGLGGGGDDGAWLPCGVGGDGGDGLRVIDAQARVRTFQCDFIGGYEGYGGCGDGAYGSDTNGPTGTIIPLTMAANQLAATPIIREANTYMLTIHGTPGQVPLLLTSTALFQRLFLPHVGVLHLPWPFNLQYLPPIPSSGTLTVPIWIPPLPATEQSRWRVMQVVLNAANGRYATRPISLTVVDSTF